LPAWSYPKEVAGPLEGVALTRSRVRRVTPPRNATGARRVSLNLDTAPAGFLKARSTRAISNVSNFGIRRECNGDRMIVLQITRSVC
jgi:hypothetical protein